MAETATPPPQPAPAATAQTPMEPNVVCIVLFSLFLSIRASCAFNHVKSEHRQNGQMLTLVFPIGAASSSTSGSTHAC